MLATKDDVGAALAATLLDTDGETAEAIGRLCHASMEAGLWITRTHGGLIACKMGRPDDKGVRPTTWVWDWNERRDSGFSILEITLSSRSGTFTKHAGDDLQFSHEDEILPAIEAMIAELGAKKKK